MHDPEKSDSGIVATKPTNKARRPAAEPVEPRPGTKGNADQQRVDDSIHATKAAVEEGIVSGGGVALLRAKAAIGKLSDDNEDVQSGINIVLRALAAPIAAVPEN